MSPDAIRAMPKVLLHEHLDGSLREQTLIEWDDWVPVLPEAEAYWGGNDEALNVSIVPSSPSPRRNGSAVSPEALFALKDEQDWLLNDGTALLYGDELIGPRGRIGAVVQNVERANLSAVSKPQTAQVHPASAVLPGKAVHIVDQDAMGRSGLDTGGHPLNVVGNAGLNPALARNLINRSRRPSPGTSVST